MLTATITKTASMKYFKPSSFSRTTNVAMQGKDIASNVAAINNCFGESAKGISIPTATSFLRNPIAKASVASFGNPNNP